MTDGHGGRQMTKNEREKQIQYDNVHQWHTVALYTKII